MDKLWKVYEIIHKKLHLKRNFVLLAPEYCLIMASWNSVFGSGSMGSGSPRADGSGRPRSLRAERSGGSEAFGPEPIGPGSVETEGSAGREAFRWNGSRGPRLRAVGPAGRDADRRKGHGPGSPRVKRFRGCRDLRVTPSNEPRRTETERSTGSSCFRAAGSMGWGSSGHRNNGRNA